MLKSERKNMNLFLHVITHLLYVMDLKKSMVSSLEKLYSGLDRDDATLCNMLVGLWQTCCILCLLLRICLSTFEVH